MQLDTGWKLWGDWTLLDRRQRSRRRKSDVGTTISGSYSSPYLLRSSDASIGFKSPSANRADASTLGGVEGPDDF